MAISHSGGEKNAALNAGQKTSFDGTTGVIRIYGGTPPANADAANANAVLSTLTLANPSFATAANGVLTANAIASDTSAAASGTATFFRVMMTTDSLPAGASGATDKRIQGTVTATGGGGDMTLNSTSITIGGTVSISSWVYNFPA